MNGLDFFQKQKTYSKRMAKKASASRLYLAPGGALYVESSQGLASECFVDLDGIVRVIATPIPIQENWRSA